MRDSLTREVVRDAIVRLYHVPEGSSVRQQRTYTITDHNGLFVLPMPESNGGRWEIDVYRIDYEVRQKRCSPSKDLVKIWLVPQVYELADVVVQDLPIRSRGDTISYMARSFIAPDTYTLEDLMRRMPGLQIDSDGAISYLGEKIQDFYIEGLNMLGRNYHLGTRNLKAEDIASVEVLENHQPVKVLRGLRNTNMASINVKLKNPNMIRPAGEFGGAIGHAQDNTLVPYEAKAYALMVNSKMQLIAVSNANNTAARIDAENMAKNTLSPQSSASNILVANSVGVPPVPAIRYSRGGSSIGSTANGINKFGEDHTLRYNIAYALVRRQSKIENRSRIGTTDGVWAFDEELEPITRAQSALSVFDYVYNGDKTYINNTVKVSGQHQQSDLRIATGGTSFEQSGYSRDIAAEDRFAYKRRTADNDLVELGGFVRYAYTPTARYSIDVSPYAYSQKVSGQDLIGGFSSDYSWVLSSRSTLTAAMIFNARYGKLATEGSRPYALNDVEGGEGSLSVSPTYGYRGERITLNAQLPLNLVASRYSYLNADHRRQLYRLARIYPGFELSGRYQSRPEWFVRARAGISRSINGGGISAFLLHPIRKGYNSLSSGAPAQWSTATSISTAATFEFKKPIEGFFASANFAVGMRISDNTIATLIKDGQIERTIIPKRNKYHMMNGRIYAAQNVRSIKTTFSLEITTNLMSSPIIRQAQDLRLRSQSWVIHPYVTTNLLSWLSVALDAKAERQSMTASVERTNHTMTYAVSSSVAVAMGKGWTLQTSSTSSIRIENRKALPAISFVDASIRYKHKRFVLDIEASNLLDVRRYELTKLSELDWFYYAYSFRSREFLARLMINF